jgi:hypothetical protein
VDNASILTNKRPGRVSPIHDLQGTVIHSDRCATLVVAMR